MQPEAPMPAPAPAASRPRPILEAIRDGMWKTVLGTAITAAATFGVLDGQQATLINNLVAAIATVVTLATSLLAQFHILSHAEPEVTPVVDPRDNDGHPLVTATPPPAATTP